MSSGRNKVQIASNSASVAMMAARSMPPKQILKAQPQKNSNEFGKVSNQFGKASNEFGKVRKGVPKSFQRILTVSNELGEVSNEFGSKKHSDC